MTDVASKLSNILGTSLHHQVSTVIKDSIVNGRYQKGETLPSEDELCQMFSVSRITVRRAMQSLEEEGLIERRRGRGTFVLYTPPARGPHGLVTDFFQSIGEFAAKTRLSVLEFAFMMPPAYVKAALKLRDKDEVLKVSRLRSGEHSPLVYLTSYLPNDIGHQFSREDFNKGAVAELLSRIGHPHGRLELAVGAALADPIIAPLLKVQVGSALVEVRRIAFDKSGRPVEYLAYLAPPERYQLTISMDDDVARLGSAWAD